jgi:hypothetical protein
MFMGGATFKQAIMEVRSKEDDDKAMELKDHEWERFRKARLQWYPKTPLVQFWPSRFKDDLENMNLRKRRLTLAPIPEEKDFQRGMLHQREESTKISKETKLKFISSEQLERAQSIGCNT